MSHAIRRAIRSAIHGVEGQAIVEAAILLPVFVLVSFMLVDIQWMTKDAAAIECPAFAGHRRTGGRYRGIPRGHA